MLPRYARPVLLLSAVAILGSVSSALGAGRVQEVVPGPGGTVLVRSLTPDAGPPLAVPPNQSAAPAPSSAPAWVDRNHMAGIAEFVALCGDGAYGVAGWWLNGMRTACYRVDSGNGVPVWNHAMPAAQFQIAVAAADGDRMTSTARSESLFVFSSASPQAIFSDWYTPPLVGYKTAISGNGYTYVGGGGNPAGGAGEVRVYDQSGALRFIRTLPAPPEGVGVSQNGLVVVANVRATAWVWDAVTGDLRGSVSIPGECQLPAVLSGDGTYLVTGGFDHAVRLYHWDGASSYVLDWAYVIPGTTWTTALAISADASTIVAGTWTNPTGGKVVAFNLGSPTPIWTDASFGDWVGSVATTADGSKIVAGSWGRSGATVGNIISVYTRDSGTPFLGIADDEVSGVGSCMSVDIDNSGTNILAGGKAIHAREFGNGGFVLGIHISPPTGVEPAQFQATRLIAEPNPFQSGTNIRWNGLRAPAEGLHVYGADGRLVRTLVSGSGGWNWDGRDARGLEAPAGTYFVSPATGPEEPVRLVRIR